MTDTKPLSAAELAELRERTATPPVFALRVRNDEVHRLLATIDARDATIRELRAALVWFGEHVSDGLLYTPAYTEGTVVPLKVCQLLAALAAADGGFDCPHGYSEQTGANAADCPVCP